MRMRARTGPIILGALLATTPQTVFGQDEGERSVSPMPSLTFNARPGTEIQSDQLSEFLAKNLSVAFGTDMRPLSVTLRLEMISREEGVIGKYESEAIEIEPGKTYDGSTFIRASNNPAFAPGFGDRRKIGFLGFGVWKDVREAWRARECEGANHAVRITLASDDERAIYISDYLLCLNAEG